MLTMRWPVIGLIFRREVRDQLRDRRTLFMIFVLPILLYPMMGLGIAQLQFAFQQRARTVVVVGSDHLPEQPPLLNQEGNRFHPRLFANPEEAARYEVYAVPSDSDWRDQTRRSSAIRDKLADVVLVIPPDIAAQIGDESRPAAIPIQYDSSSEQSLDAYRDVKDILDRWKDLILRDRLERDAKAESYVQPVEVQSSDVARVKGASVNIWARMFPFLLVIMSLTGAFYPAIDLCAGEKERGTMETLLISPATRAEIVAGKFLTVLLASMASALLNLVSLGITAMALSRQIGRATGSLDRSGVDPAMAIAAPSLVSAFWMILLLIPLSIFFSALSVALAAMARSMKEGQYYLTPLYLITLPLVFVTLAPGIELDLFTSLLPVTGVSLLLRTLILGDYAEARRYFLPVLLPLMVYGALALRWAVEQFLRESVLFRESERFDLRSWLRHLIRDRQPTPNASQTLLCFVLMLGAAWFATGFLGTTWTSMIAGQLIFVLGPPLFMTLILTSSPRQTLLLRWPSWKDLGMAIALALAVQPLVAELRQVVEVLFPVSDTLKQSLEQFLGTIPNLGLAFMTLALVPAICEEVAFRGFILQGLRREFRLGSAIVLSALLFGFLHVLLSLFQQLFNATLLGLLLGLIAVRSRSLLPGIVFHAINNGMALIVGAVVAGDLAGDFASRLFRDPSNGLYHKVWVVFSGVLTAILIVVLLRTGRAHSSPSRESTLSPNSA